ncbi:MAG TPA: hypothetical protein DCZ11_07050 [Gammaproteobacteria bacterium]|nr:hypothetical protein [Gammaproteobacteria bacterium]MCH78183.1 hypothetical protein [Gammaproteobacteria bacterium]
MTSSQASTPRLGWREALPPLLVYLAAGLSGVTNIVATFFAKEHLGLLADFVAALGFWTTLPWTLKMASATWSTCCGDSAPGSSCSEPRWPS